MSEDNSLNNLLCGCFNIYIKFYGILKGIFDVYVKNILLYYDPLEIKLVFQNIKKKFKTYNKLKKYDTNKYDFIYKINKVEKQNGKFFNFGYCYHTSKINSHIFYPVPIIAYPPELIQSVIITFKNKSNSDSDKLVLKDCVKHKFISHILSYATKESILSVLIYYYLQRYLNIFDIINNVELEIDGNYYEVNYDDKLGNIYDKLENELD
jgi:hypothetical protein